MIIKKIISVLVTMSIVLTMFSAVSFANTENDVRIFINGQRMVIPSGYGSPFIDTQNRTQIPVRAVSEALGYDVEWENSIQTVTINGNISLKIGDNKVNTPNGTVVMDTKAVIIEGRTFVPLRFIVEALDYEIDYKFTQGYHRIDILKPVSNTEVDSDVIVVDVSNVNVPRYTRQNNGIRSDIVGSSNNSILGTRNPNSTLQEDISKFNEALKGTGFMISSSGRVQMSGLIMDDPSSKLILGRDENNNPMITIRDWAKPGQTFQMVVVPTNVAMEAMKYYSVKPSDGEAIWWDIDRMINQRRGPVYDEVYLYGETKVIHRRSPLGPQVIFVD